MKEPLVSVYCLAYNHGPYIESALNGFVSQKTDFPFEVIVHDDASTDGTRDIIMKYHEMYPDIIKPILQDINQYSQRIPITYTFIFPVLKGEYIAICEGDDYWTDENKLQKQVDFLKKNPDYVACVHNTYMENMKSGVRKIMFPEKSREIGLADVVISGSSAYHTSSLMYRREYLYNRPDFIRMVPRVGDYPLSIFLALSGKIMYFNDIMSVYRKSTEGSWSEREFANAEKKINNKKHCTQMLIEANKWSEFKYNEIFNKAILNNEYKILELQGKYSEMMKSKYKCLRKNGDYLKLLIKRFLPFVIKIRNKISAS